MAFRGTMPGFPEVTESVTGDPQGDPGFQFEQGPADEAPLPAPPKPSFQRPMQGPWLTDEPEKVAKDIVQRWEAQNPAMKSRFARWDLNVRRREGDAFSKLVKNTDDDTYRVYTPRGIEDAPPSLNKTDDLCVKMNANLLVDPPKPECEPQTDDDADRSAAELATRLLMNESTESGMNIPALVEEAEDLANTHGTGFVYAYVDPQGGGHRPREVMAPMEAMEIDENGQPVPPVPQPDPLTGQPVPVVMGEPTLRYVGLDGKTIVDDPTQAEMEWLPKVCGDVLTGEHVRFFPDTCRSIADADGVIIALPQRLDQLKARFEGVAKMQPDELRKLVSWRPEIAKRIIPRHAGNGEGTKGPNYDPSQGPPGDAIVITLTAYHKGDGEYPMAAYVVVAGERFTIHRQEWKEKVRLAGDKMVERAMDVPVAPFRQFRKRQDPYGRGLVDKVGDGDPLTAFAIGAIVEYMHRVNNPHLFVPIGSGIQPKSLQLPRGTPIPYNPAGGGLPKQEEIANLPTTFMEFILFIQGRQNSASGLEASAQGTNSPSVQSGKHAQQVIEQALVALSGVKNGMESGYMRLCRVVLQLWRMAATRPQRLKITGENGAYKEREFMASDLGSTTDVKIQAGTSTMLAASAKSAIALEKLQVGAIALEDFQRQEEGNVRALIGAQDNPHKTRIRGQISDWMDGPPEGWQPQPPMVDPLTGQPMVDPMTGQPVPPPPDPQNPFSDVRPVDMEQAVALMRHAELSRAVAGSKFGSKPDPWRQYLLAEYEAMRQAAGITTLAEQQMAMQQQAQAQQQAESEAAGREDQRAERKHQQSMEALDAKGGQQLAAEQQRAENQAAASQMLPPKAPGKASLVRPPGQA